jgi:hypothetical protein
MWKIIGDFSMFARERVEYVAWHLRNCASTSRCNMRAARGEKNFSRTRDFFSHEGRSRLREERSRVFARRFE